MNDSTSVRILKLGTLHGNQREIVYMNIRQTLLLFCFHAILHAEAKLTWNTADWYNQGSGRFIITTTKIQVRAFYVVPFT